MLSPAQTSCMTSKMKILLALIVATAIIVLFVLPAFDIDPTAMRSARAAALLMFSIACAAFTFVAFKTLPSSPLEPADRRTSAVPDLLEVTCSLLC